MEDYEEATLASLDFEPATDRLRRRHPELVQTAYRVGGMACFATIYPVAVVLPRHVAIPWPFIVAGLAYAGVRCLHEAARSTMSFEPQAPDSA